MEVVWSTIHNAGCKQTAGERLVKKRSALYPGVALSISDINLDIR